MLLSIGLNNFICNVQSERWKRSCGGDKILKDGKPVLQFVAVERKDNGEWAIPGVSVLTEAENVMPYNNLVELIDVCPGYG